MVVNVLLFQTLTYIIEVQVKTTFEIAIVNVNITFFIILFI